MIIKHGKGKATFIFDNPTDSPVFLIGDFNGWNPSLDPMEKNGDGKWQVVKTFKPGAYQFKYLILDLNGEQWFNDWRADAYVKSPFGGENSVVIIE
ncbi:MAG: isoamylase early set domain-containing protein [Oligoflexia bacterium]|nr:isoamylase early set domain-containing protein [Oligoflexia bacterium]